MKHKSILIWDTPHLLLLVFLLVGFVLGCNRSKEVTESVNEKSVMISIDAPLHGKLSLEPSLQSGATIPMGTVVTAHAQPDEGYVLDSLYYAVDGEWGPQYYESMTEGLQITVTRPLRIGAAFLRQDLLSGLEVIQDVIYARPGVKPLKYDIFKPADARNLPLIVIIHGGGWRTNDENIMRGMAREMARTGRYVVASIDYRWLGTLDGDTEPNQVWQLIEDVFGAILHIQEHAPQYGADPKRIALTGDSAGGHLCASAAVMLERIGSKGFTAPEYQFLPTYLPGGLSAEDARKRLLESIKVAAPSYGVFGGPMLAQAVGVGEDLLRYIAPIDNIPSALDRSIPHYLIRGSGDPLIPQEMIQSYANALREKGQTVQIVEVEGAGHAFFDWKPDAVTRKTFERFGIPYIKDMLIFIDRYL
ncbi:MAG: alpha/beta hydrolase [Spirochaetota bacterium]